MKIMHSSSQIKLVPTIELIVMSLLPALIVYDNVVRDFWFDCDGT